MRKIKGYRSKLREVNAKTKNLNNTQISDLTGISRPTVIRWMGEGVMFDPNPMVWSTLVELYGLKNPYDLLEPIFEDDESEVVAELVPAGSAA